MIAGVEAQTDYTGLAVGYVGLYQFNVRVPSVPSGDQRFEVTIDGKPMAQVLYITLE